MDLGAGLRGNLGNSHARPWFLLVRARTEAGVSPGQVGYSTCWHTCGPGVEVGQAGLACSTFWQV